MGIPIKIQIDDNKKFGDVCFLLDSGDFIARAELIRKKLGLAERFHGTFNEWKLRNSSDEQERLLDKLFHKVDIGDKEKITKELASITPSDEHLEKVAMDGVTLMGLHIEIEKLHDFFAFPDLLNDIVFASMLCDTMSDEDYSLARIDFFDTSSNPQSPRSKRRPYFGIEITPWTRMSDIEAIFKIKDKFKLDYCAFYGQFDFHLDKDSISNIKRDREWYWRNKNGESYLDIARAEANKYEIAPDDLKGSIAKAIGQYKRRLTKQHERMV